MDAQNAAEPASTKPPAASPKRPGTDADHPRPPAVTKLSSAGKPDLSLKDGRLGASSARLGDEDAVGDGNSDAETIVLPGKDGHSPSKVRKIIKHENSDTEDGPSTSSSLLSRKHSHLKQDRDGDKGDRGARTDRPEKPEKSVSATGIGQTESTVSILGRKKKQLDKSKAKDGSSGLSSAPGSPPPTQRRRRPSNDHSKSDSETAPAEFTKSSIKDRGRPLDKVVPHKRKAPRPDSDDEAENRKIRRQRTSGSGLDASRKHHFPPSKSQTELASPAVPAVSAARNRSISPHSRVHRRSISTTQLPGQSSNGLSHKKKRIPAPLQSTDYLSDESSASGSPHPRSSKLRGLATPATADSNASPAKMAPHKKHLDAHGQTFLARACAKGEYDVAKHRLQERPEDINVADYAGNTPLQIAALNGYDDIVKLLVDAGCYLDCVNNDKDTPLLDAVENGHLDVVKILLDAGVNPRKANAYGQEPIDRVNDELDYADEIRRVLREAKAKMGERRRTSEEHQPDQTDTRSSYGPDSPRRSPGAMGSAHTAAGRRSGTVRATKTSNHLLYMPMDDKTLRSAAARGDEETVTRILQVRENFDDPESMVAAARGGHDIVMQLLLALGRANPDPSPLSSQSSEYSTPMLAAIGQENLKVVRLLLDQGNFDPTHRIKGEAYYEIAKRRRGPNWMEEEHMLKDAYDKYRKSHKGGSSKNRSPNRREQEREPRRKLDTKDDAAKLHKRKAVSPTREPKRLTATKLSASPKEKRRASSLTAQPDDQTSPKRGPGRPKKDDRIPTIAVSDREPSPAGRPAAKIRRAESDMAAVSSEGETTKPRRKLVSGRELKGERERQRRPSLTSNASSMKEPSSPREEPEKVQMSEKYHDRTKALKRDESRDRLSVSGDNTGKRHRSSATPPHLGLSDKDSGDIPVKRRRLDADNKDGKEKRPKSSQSDDKHLKAPAPRDSGLSSAAGSRAPSKTRDEEERKPAPKPKKTEALLQHGRREGGKPASSEGSIHVKSEDQDVDMPDAPPATTNASEPKPISSQKDDEAEKKKKQAEVQARAREASRKEEEIRRREEEEKKKEKEKEKEQEMEKERLRREEESKKLAETEARKREEEEKRRKEEDERKRKEEDERRKREEDARKAREDEQKRRLQEEQRRRREEAERKRKEEEAEKRQKEEQDRKKREEEERLRREQLEREAVEEARRQREEEEKREQERKERAHREEMERRRAAREAERAAREAEQRRIRLEQERARLAKLPPVLRWLDEAANPKTAEVAEKFSTIQGVRYDCINPEANGTAAGREQWLLNTQVALLLGEKDLTLSRYTAWRRVPASPVAKRAIWRLESDRYALTTPALYEIGEQLEGYYRGVAPKTMSYTIIESLRAEAWAKFEAMDLFFVKASDFLFIISTVQHLRHVKITMTYCEFPENEAQISTWTSRQKWRNDPDAKSLAGFAPSNKHYVNGHKISEDKPCLREASTSPFPRQRIPRRSLPSISSDGLAHMALSKERSMDLDTQPPNLPNGVHSSPINRVSHGGNGEINGRQPLSLATAVAANGTGNHPISPSSEAGPAQARPLINGTHDTHSTTTHTE